MNSGTYPTYRKRPVEVQALQYTGDNVGDMVAFGGQDVHFIEPEDRDEDPECDLEVFDRLHYTWVKVYKGQWIIKGTKGEFYPCDNEVFEEVYELVV